MAIPQFILAQHEAVADLCRRAHARRLEVFGSAVRDDFSVETSDLDFLVELEAVQPGEYAEHYFVLKEGLEQLFRRPVDLFTASALVNPYLKARIDSERQVVYAA
jgi:predicted nucleotidyltransferase